MALARQPLSRPLPARMRAVRLERGVVHVLRGLAWELERAVHRVREVLAEGGEEERAVVLDPEVAALVDEVVEGLLAASKVVGGFEVFFVVPGAVAAAYGRFGDDAFALNAEEEVDGCLLVRICKLSAT